jgi:hypothetical protein
MTNCPNCGAALGCSCQLRTDENGVTKCTSCIDSQVQEIIPQTEVIEHIHINLDNERPPTEPD